MLDTIKKGLYGFVLGLVVGAFGILLITSAFKGCGGTSDWGDDVSVYTNTIYTNSINPIVPIWIKTNGTEVCIDSDSYYEIYGDYICYSTSPFLVVRSNDTLSVSLCKRKTVYKIPSEKKKSTLIIGVGYPLNIMADFTFFYGFGVYTLVQTNNLCVGLSYKFEF